LEIKPALVSNRPFFYLPIAKFQAMSYQIQSFEEYQKTYAESVANPESFWAGIAEEFSWMKKWDRVVDWEFQTPEFKWFEGAELNITVNCLDRHLKSRGDKVAILWEPNDPADATVSITYKELHGHVCKMANVLKSNGVKKGDRICLYMPMIPELAVAVLACARIGAIHSVVFAGFSANALADRINDATCKVVITGDEIKRGGKQIPAKTVVDEALKSCPCVETVLVARSTGNTIPMTDNRDKWLEEEMAIASDECPAEVMNAEDLLFILYTSGSTGKPKGVVHTCAGYMVYAGYSFSNVFQYQENDIYWCTADIGWVTGHSYIVYGPLLNGATTVMFEGIPTWPNAGRFWEVCDKLKVNQFYTAPTAIRALMACGDEHVEPYKLDSLRLLGTVGEPINVEAWNWYHDKVGRGKCAVVDTWWQTETGGIMLSGLGSLSPMKPSYAGHPLPGVQPVILDQDGEEITEPNVEGLLAIKYPWPGILRTTYGDHQRCKDTYFSMFDDHYFTGDGAKKDENGMIRVIGRVDDVMNISGHRIGTAEVENAIDEHPAVIESAVVGYPHEIKGQGIYAYVICRHFPEDQTSMRDEIVEVVNEHIGKIARPEKIQFVNGLPKTRSGKIMRRILRKVAEGDASNLGDTSTLLDPTVVEDITKGAL
jgi:acetyl-CoA synthetase